MRVISFTDMWALLLILQEPPWQRQEGTGPGTSADTGKITLHW